MSLRLRHVARATAIAVALSLSSIGLADAASLQISPIRLDLSAEQPAAALTLHNQGGAPINAQVRVFAWSQSIDQDRLERTNRVVASPPIVSIAPGADQTVRILRTASDAVAAEETYRLLIDEIPEAQTAQTTAVRMQLRYSVPVFVGAVESTRAPTMEFSLEHAMRPPPSDPAANPASSTSAAPVRVLTLRADNVDVTHAQLSQVRVEWPDGRQSELAPGLLGYALPHSTRRWAIANAPQQATRATLRVTVNGTPIVRQINFDSQRTDRPSEARTP